MPPRKKIPARLSHLTSSGAARMVDVAAKPVTSRRAIAEAEVALTPDAFRALAAGAAPKGDALAVARLAGIQAAKRTPDLIPLCHPLPISKIEIDIQLIRSRRVARIRAEVCCEAKTGVEMEAMTAASVAALALYDMLKGIDKAIVIGPIRLIEKSGGKSGDWRAKA
jgi:cyclic pyranopterin phosphate synthase